MSKRTWCTAILTLQAALGMGCAWAAYSKPLNSKPADTKPLDGKPAETKSAEAKPADAKPQAPKYAGYQAFAALKQLVGEWRSEGPPGQPPSILRFRVEERDSVLAQTFFPGTSEQMVTMYHLDGPDLVGTHYCSSGNQPQLRLNGEETKVAGLNSSAGSYVFDYVGATNLRGSNDTHMGEYTLIVLDDNHIVSIYTVYKGSMLLTSGKNTFERVEPVK